MNPLRLRLRNVRSFREIDLELPTGVLAIIGDNGAGKTTVASAIDVALFGPESRSLAPWYPRGAETDEPLLIELLFEHGNDIYRVRRTFSPKGRGTSKLDLDRALAHGADEWEPLTLESQAATQEYVEALVGLSRATFRSSSYLAQGDTGAFCEAPPAARKQILSEAIGLRDWEVWLKQARTERRLRELRAAELQGALERADAELEQRDSLEHEQRLLRDRQRNQKTELKETLNNLKEAHERLAELRRAASAREATERTLTTAVAAEQAQREAIGQRTQEIAVLEERLAATDEVKKAAGRLSSLEKERDLLGIEINLWQEGQRLAKAIEQETATIELHMEKGRGYEGMAEQAEQGVDREHCDRCGQVLGADAARRAAASYRADAEKESVLVKEADERRDKMIAAYHEMPKEQPDLERWSLLPGEISVAQQASRQLAALVEASARHKVAWDELTTLQKELPAFEQAVADASKALAALGTYDPEVDFDASTLVGTLAQQEESLRSRIETTASTLAHHDEALRRIEEIEGEAKEQRAAQAEAREDAALYAALERACGANGVPALILETVAIPQIEAEASRLLAKLGGPAHAAELRTLRETKTGELADTLDIVLLTETGEAPYEAFSGGERARIAFALRLALAQLLASRRGAPTGLLVIDEMAGLDAPGVAALVEVLESLQAQIPRIVCVSHQAELRDAFAQTLMLENVDGYSRVANGGALEPVA